MAAPETAEQRHQCLQRLLKGHQDERWLGVTHLITYLWDELASLQSQVQKHSKDVEKLLREIQKHSKDVEKLLRGIQKSQGTTGPGKSKMASSKPAAMRVMKRPGMLKPAGSSPKGPVMKRPSKSKSELPDSAFITPEINRKRSPEKLLSES